MMTMTEECVIPHPIRSTSFFKEDDMNLRTTPPVPSSSSSSSSTPLSLEQSNLLKFKIEVLINMLALEEKKSQRMMAMLSQRSGEGNPNDNTDDSQLDMIGAMDRMRFEFRDNRSNIIKSFADEDGNVVACMSRDEFQRQLYASTESVSKADVRFFSIRFFDGSSVCVTEFLDYFLTPASTRAAKAAANAVRMSVRLLEIRHRRSTPCSSSIVAQNDDDNSNRITNINDMETPKAVNNSKFQHPRNSTLNLSQSQEQEEQRNQPQQIKHNDKVTELVTSSRDDHPPNEDVINRSVLFSKGTVEELEDCVDINDDDDFVNDSPVMGTIAKPAAAEAKVIMTNAFVPQPSADISENPMSRDKEESIKTSIPETATTHAHNVEDDVGKNTDDKEQVSGETAVTSVSNVSSSMKVAETDSPNANITSPPPVVEVKEISSVTITTAGKPDDSSADDVPATKTTWSSRLSNLGGRIIGKGGQKDGTAAATTTLGSADATAAATTIQQTGSKEQDKTAASGEAPVPKGILKGVASSIYQSSTGLGSRMLGRKEETAPSPERKTSTADPEGSLPDSTQQKGSITASIKRKMFSFGRTPANPN